MEDKRKRSKAKGALTRAINAIKRDLTKTEEALPITTAERHRDELISAYKNLLLVHDEYIDTLVEPSEEVLQTEESWLDNEVIRFEDIEASIDFYIEKRKEAIEATTVEEEEAVIVITGEKENHDKGIEEVQVENGNNVQTSHEHQDNLTTKPTETTSAAETTSTTTTATTTKTTTSPTTTTAIMTSSGETAEITPQQQELLQQQMQQLLLQHEQQKKQLQQQLQHSENQQLQHPIFHDSTSTDDTGIISTTPVVHQFLPERIFQSSSDDFWNQLPSWKDLL